MMKMGAESKDIYLVYICAIRVGLMEVKVKQIVKEAKKNPTSLA